MFGFNVTKRAERLYADYEQVATAINNETESHKLAGDNLKMAVRELQEAVAEEALGGGSPEAVAAAREAIRQRRREVDQAAERRGALQTRLVKVAGEMASLLPGLGTQMLDELDELKASFRKEWAAAMATLGPLMAKRKAAERVAGKLDLPEPTAAEPTEAEVAPVRSHYFQIRSVLTNLAYDGELRGPLAGANPEMLGAIRAAQGQIDVASQIQAKSIAAERQRKAKEEDDAFQEQWKAAHGR